MRTRAATSAGTPESRHIDSTTMRRPRKPTRTTSLAIVVVVVVTTATVLTGTAANTYATESPPSWPIADVLTGPPPVAAYLPTADATPPPAEVIADPITSGAVCTGWHLQGNYGDRWPATRTWWEYECSRHVETYFDDPNPCEGSMCQPACYGYPWGCYTLIDDWTDHFYWNGANAVFYGQAYAQSIDYAAPQEHWWDATQGRWYSFRGPYLLTVSQEGAGSGVVISDPAGIHCGDTCRSRFDADTVVSLTAIADPPYLFTGWGGFCWGLGPCTVTMDEVAWVTATFEPDLKQLAVDTDGPGTGTVTSIPAGIDCGETCVSRFPTGSSVTLTATPGPSSLFAGWIGACTGTGPCQLPMDEPRWARATFTTDPPPAPPPPTATERSADCQLHDQLYRLGMPFRRQRVERQ